MFLREDLFLQPFHLRRLAARNRIVSAAHELVHSEDGMPKDRYRLYHVDKAKGGIALTMIARSAIVPPDSPPLCGESIRIRGVIYAATALSETALWL